MNRIVEVVRALKHRSRSAAACPRCGSLNISKSSGMDGWLLPPLYVCNDCAYVGRLVLEIEAQDNAREASADGRRRTIQ